MTPYHANTDVRKAQEGINRGLCDALWDEGGGGGVGGGVMSPVLRREGRCLARTQRWPTDSPSQVELGDGIDGQPQADQVAVGVVLVGTVGRLTVLERTSSH